jgi:hypothetical protein
MVRIAAVPTEIATGTRLHFHLRATRDITKKDEEITFNYIGDLMEPAPNRQVKLRSYGFQCTCEACSNPVSSDAKRKKIREFMKQTFSTDGVWRQMPSPEDVSATVKLMEEEGLQNKDQQTLKTLGDRLSMVMRMGRLRMPRSESTLQIPWEDQLD